VEISASADLAIAVSEEGMNYAVDERGVNGDGATAREVQAGNGAQPEMIRSAATLLILNNAAADVRKRPAAIRPFQPQCEG